MDYRKRLYESYVTTHFGQVRDFSEAALTKQCQAFQHYFGNLLPKELSAHILEIGCGYGSFLYYLKIKGYINAEGVDISPEQAETAHGLGLNNVVCTDAITFLLERPGHYDWVVAIDLVDHLPKAEVLNLFDAVYQGLRPGGSFIFQAVNGGSPFASRYRYGDFTHELAFTATSSQQILRAAGFEETRFFGTDPFVHGLRSFIRVFLWKAFKAFLWLYLVAETGMTRNHIFTQNLIAVARKPHS